jgi:hypothetical protein
VVAGNVVGVFQSGTGSNGNSFLTNVRVSGTTEFTCTVNFHNFQFEVSNHPHAAKHQQQQIAVDFHG